MTAKRSRKLSRPGGEPSKREAFLHRIGAVFGLRRPEAVAAFSGRRDQSLRFNPLHGRSVAEIRAELAATYPLEPLQWCPEASFLPEGSGPAIASPLFSQGEIYVQNASSFVPVLALDPHPGDEILDLAASPGGKASHIAARTGNQASLWLNDGLPARLSKLREVTELLGVRYERMTSFPAQYADRYIEKRFDRILLDAQCSGEGRINLARSGALKLWSLDRVQEYGYLQQRMLNAAFKLLKPGGILVYTTCTVSPEENESPVSALLSRAEAADVEPIEIDLDAAALMTGMRSWEGREFDARLEKALRLRPGRFFEPFFVCKLRKAASAEL